MTKEDLQKAFKKPLPGEPSHLKMTHSNRFSFTNDEHARENAVLILIYNKYNELHVLFTKRGSNKKDKHSGQISFPGGGKEPIDQDLQQTAIRECFEEIGILVSQNSIIGVLSDLYIPVSNNNVKPFVAWLDYTPKNFALQTSEIAEVIEVPFSFLLDSNNIKEKTVEFKSQQVTIPYFDYNGIHIWGATGMITKELIDIIYQE